MIENIVAKRYAKALMGAVQDEVAAEQVCEDLRTLAASLEAVPELNDYWQNPLIDAAGKSKVLSRVLDGAGAHAILIRFLDVVARRRRFGLLPLIASQFQELTDARTGKVRAEVTSAIALNDKQVQRLRQALSTFTGKVVVLEMKVDLSLIGGLRIRIGDDVLEGSVQSRLQLLQ